MRRPPSTLQTTRRRPWLLAWLLPLLFWCVGGEMLHSHAPLETGHTAAAAFPSAFPDSATHAQDAPDLAASGDCLACAWAAHHAATPAVVPLSSPRPRAQTLTAGVVVAPVSPLRRAFDGRGPPLV